MLVENKFLFISIPRCASTSFQISCLKNNFDLKFANNQMGTKVYNWYEKIMNYDNEKIADLIPHIHESVYDLENKFGYDYPIISIKRNQYERFISLYKHIIDECLLHNENEFAEILKKLSIDEILNIDKTKLQSYDEYIEMVNNFIKNYDNKIINSKSYIINMFIILFRPVSFLHNNNSKIIWFDIENLTELEYWVQNITNKKFKMEKINSSKNFECSLELNDNFIKKYNSVFLEHDTPKKIKTFI